MTFLELYTDQLDQELGSSDTNLFTTDKRKAAINRAQLWWVVETECVQRTKDIAVVDEQAEYDLITEIADEAFLSISRQGPEIIVLDTDSNKIRQYAGNNDFQRVTIPWLNQYLPDWRSVQPSQIPMRWYERIEAGHRYFGIQPSPDIISPYTWTLKVPYVVRVPDMTADDDVPFTVASTTDTSLIPWHDALAIRAAWELEKLRKDTERSEMKRAAADARLADYLAAQKVPYSRTLNVMRSYRHEQFWRGAGWGQDAPGAPWGRCY